MSSADGINTVTEDGASGLFSGSLSVHIQIAKPNSFAWEIKLWKSLEMVETEKYKLHTTRLQYVGYLCVQQDPSCNWIRLSRLASRRGLSSIWGSLLEPKDCIPLLDFLDVK